MSNWYDERENEYNAQRYGQPQEPRVPTILDHLRKQWSEWNPPEGPNTPSFLDTWVNNSLNEPRHWKAIKQGLGMGGQGGSNMDTGRLPSMADDIQGAGGPLLSRIAAMLRGDQGETQLATPQRPMQLPPLPQDQRAEATTVPAMNWLTPPPQVTDWDSVRELMADRASSRKPGYPLNNQDPYADDPLRYFTERLMR